MKRREQALADRRSQRIGAIRPRRHSEAGQSAIIAVIVLFLLLFLGAAFIALIANNLNNTKRAAVTSESGRYAEAGIRYLDDQLTTSPLGADWRPTPECPPSVDGTCSVDPTKPFNAVSNPLKITNTDPDFFWLQYSHYDVSLREYVGGYTRVNFGGPTPGAANAGGRALVRLTYRPDVYTPDGNPAGAAGGGPPDPNYPPDPSHKFIRLDSVGRTGQIDPVDPTTFGNTNSLGQRVELSAYKQIGINEYVRQIYNKDNKPDSFSLGAPAPVLDYNVSGGTPTAVSRNIESIFDGPMRVNGNLTWYGVNRILLNPNRDDALLVSGRIEENGIPPLTTTATTVNDPTQVYVYNFNGGAQTAVEPSSSPIFNTAGGLIRDNPRGADVLDIPYLANGGNADQTNANLRGVARTQPPLMDQVIGPNNLTRYLALTRDSQPLPASQVGGTVLPPSAGTFGWGNGMYINNSSDLQNAGPFGSPRAEWLNPTNYGGNRPWRSDSSYEPYAVDINLTPGYMVLTDKGQSTTQGSYFQAPSGTIAVKSGATTTNVTVPGGAGSYLPQTSIVRYSGATPPTNSSIPDGTPLLPGYPVTAVPTANNVYSGDYVIYAEGNVRIHGLVGGTDGSNTYIRHLTVVSNGIIYIDGNLLRDNLPSNNGLHGVSSIALLAKNYVAVNTTQFLASTNSLWKGEQDALQPPFSRVINATPGSNTIDFHLVFGPIDRDNTPLTYPNGPSGTGNPPTPTLFVRDAADIGAAAGGGGESTASGAAVRLALNPDLTTTVVYYQFGEVGAPDPATLLLPSTPIQTGVNGSSTTPGFNDQVFPFNGTVGAPNNAIGFNNDLQVQYDPASSQENYLLTRFGVAPLDIRIEAMMYAQEGSFFIIPGPWFNPSSDDTLTNYLNTNSPSTLYRRAGESTAPDGTTLTNVNPYFPFNGQPMDIRITFFGTIAENVPAEIGDQGSWLEKWGWVPNYWGSSALPTAGQSGQTQAVAPVASEHGPFGYLQFPMNQNALLNTATAGTQPAGGNGIVYQFDDRAISPYYDSGGGNYQPIRPDLTKIAYMNGGQPVYMPLPLTPNLPVAPGLLYFGEDTNVPQ